VLAVGALRFAPFARRVTTPLLRDDGKAFQVPHVHRGVTYVDRRFVERAHAGGRQVHVWTIDDRAEMVYLLDLGVDGVITDRTDVLREVLIERGQWEGTS
jgi:glycerophosphoryl diester phosphodiesterase